VHWPSIRQREADQYLPAFGCALFDDARAPAVSVTVSWQPASPLPPLSWRALIRSRFARPPADLYYDAASILVGALCEAATHDRHLAIDRATLSATFCDARSCAGVGCTVTLSSLLPLAR
jgi:hypothetical protein